MDITIQLLHFLRGAGFTLGNELNDTACETAQASDIPGAVARSDAAAILNGPVTPIHFENALWTYLFWRATGCHR